MNAPLPSTAERVFALFLGLEQQARKAGSTEQLAFAMVNDGQALFGFRHAALLIGTGCGSQDRDTRDHHPTFHPAPLRYRTGDPAA